MPKEDEAIELYYKVAAHCAEKFKEAARAGVPISELKARYYTMIQEAQSMMNRGNDADALWTMNYLIGHCDQVDQMMISRAASGAGN